MPVWESDRGQVMRDGEVVAFCYLPGDSLMPNPVLADVIRGRMESWEEANPGMWDEMMPPKPEPYTPDWREAEWERAATALANQTATERARPRRVATAGRSR